jgi:hypothetical protein
MVTKCVLKVTETSECRNQERVSVRKNHEQQELFLRLLCSSFCTGTLMKYILSLISLGPGNCLTLRGKVWSGVEIFNLFSGIAQSVYRRATGWTVGVRFLARERDISVLHSGQTCSGALPASYQWAPGALYWREIWRGLDRNTPPSSAEVKNVGAIPPLPHTSSWRGA